jgi:hypothetical protein
LIGRRRGSWERRRERLSDEESFFAEGAGFQIPAGELMEEVLPGSGEDIFFRMTFLLRFLQVKKGSGFFEFGFGVAGGQEPVVADFDEASGQDMEEEAADKFLGGECHLSGIFG